MIQDALPPGGLSAREGDLPAVLFSVFWDLLAFAPRRDEPAKFHLFPDVDQILF